MKMTQFTEFAELKVIEGGKGKNMPASTEAESNQDQITKMDNVFNDDDWKRETMLGNDTRNSDQFFLAMQHYNAAIFIARKNLKGYRNQEEIPASIVPAVVVSYLNLAQLWTDQNRQLGKKKCLVEAFDYLVTQFEGVDIATSLHNQLCHGIGKIYTELIVSLQEIDDQETLKAKEAILMSL